MHTNGPDTLGYLVYDLSAIECLITGCVYISHWRKWQPLGNSGKCHLPNMISNTSISQCYFSTVHSSGSYNISVLRLMFTRDWAYYHRAMSSLTPDHHYSTTFLLSMNLLSCQCIITSMQCTQHTGNSDSHKQLAVVNKCLFQMSAACFIQLLHGKNGQTLLQVDLVTGWPCFTAVFNSRKQTFCLHVPTRKHSSRKDCAQLF